MDSRQDQRSDRRQDLADRMANPNHDWDGDHDWEDHWDHDHSDWIHGNWHGHWDSHWGSYWNNYPLAAGLGLTCWGVNRINYWFGYSNYYNPYPVQPYYAGATYIDYSQPLVYYEQQAMASQPAVAQQAPAAQAPQDPAQQALVAARIDFTSGDYARAMEDLNKALAINPDDANLHEFRALILFAQGKYHDAAATLHAVLAVGPGWDWTTLSSMYSGQSVYTTQLRALEDAVKANPDQADTRFVLAYQYLTQGNTQAAAQQYEAITKLQPKDEVSAQLLVLTGGKPAAPSAPAFAPPAPPAGDVPPAIPQDKLVGNWNAAGTGDAKFQLQLDDKGQFTWTYSAGGKQQASSGVYVMQGDNLALQPDSGGTMLAQVKLAPNGQMHFQAAGGPPNDPGLDFRKS